MMKRKQQFMTDEVWEAILHDYIVPYRFHNQHCPPTFIGHKDSEPLLDRKLPDRLRSLPPDMKIDVYSNGVLLPRLHDTGRDFIELLASLPNRVRYLMSYHPRNHDGSENNYTDTVIYLRNVLRDPPPNVEFITVSHRSKWVTPDMQAWWKQVWQGQPITIHCNASLNPWTGLIHEEEGMAHFNGCPYGDFGAWFFGVTGNVIACCMDLEEEIVLGNVLTHDPAQMFAATEVFYAEQRRILAAKERHPRGVCSNCFGQDRADLVQLGVPT